MKKKTIYHTTRISKVGRIFQLLLLAGLCAVTSSCKKGPKVIAEPVEAQHTTSSGIFDSQPTNNPSTVESAPSNNLHSVVALETKGTKKYTYIKVREGNKEYWVATSKKDITPGGSYFYSSSIRKTNFESIELGRVFDELFLIGNIVRTDHGNQIRKGKMEKVDVETHSTSNPVQSKVDFKSGDEITISALIENPSKFENKQIQLTGTVEKVNSNILGRNWIHLKDGSMDDYDLVITSTQRVVEGNIIKIEGKVSLDVDFGAGYRYDIIVEDARIF